MSSSIRAVSWAISSAREESTFSSRNACIMQPRVGTLHANYQPPGENRSLAYLIYLWCGNCNLHEERHAYALSFVTRCHRSATGCQGLDEGALRRRYRR